MLYLVSLILLAINIVAVSAQESSSCPLYDPSKIKLVTFDCFAALMNWEGNFYYLLLLSSIIII